MGRPRLFDERLDRHIRLYVTAQQRRELADVARQNGMPVSRVVREAVNEYVADYGETRLFRPRRRQL